MNSYHFDVGNSSTGPIGLCARVKAETKAEALAILKEALPELQEVIVDDVEDDRIEYINVYINSDAITEADSADDMTDQDPETPRRTL